MLKLVPFNDTWITHDKIDVHAIYRRPSLVEDRYGDLVQRRGPDGRPLWDITTPLPVKQHNKWRAKGYEYVTLARRDDLLTAAQKGTLAGGSIAEYAQDPRTGGPWNIHKYMDGEAVAATDDLAQLRADVAEFGAVAVEKIRRSVDPGFVMPDDLKPHAEAVAEGEAVRKTHSVRKGAA